MQLITGIITIPAYLHTIKYWINLICQMNSAYYKVPKVIQMTLGTFYVH
jgi:hypothetical protein